jgi:type I restriction enzyme S subunit
MDEWKEIYLGEVIKIKHGYAFKSEYFSDEGEYIVLTPGNFFEEGGFKLREDKNKFYSSEYPKEYLLSKEDLIIAMTEQGDGLLGSSALIPDDNKFLHNQRLGLVQIKDDEKIDKIYLYYLFNTSILRSQIFASATGLKVRHTAPERVYKCRVNIPPLPIQKKIAAILSAYDDLIENNLKQIRLLEEMAQITYQEWFVRLQFPNHENTPIDETTGLPIGWENCLFGDIVKNFDNKRIPLSSAQRLQKKGVYPYYGAASIFDYIDEYIFDGKYLLMGEDGTVITTKGTPSIQFVNGKFWVNNHSHVLRGTKVSTEFLYVFLNQYQIAGHITGSAQPKINQKNMNLIKVTVASKNVMLSFDDLLIPIFEQIFNLNKQNQRLKEARDILLPRLMTGKITVD